MAENFESYDSITKIRDTLNEVRDAAILLGFMLSDRSTKRAKRCRVRIPQRADNQAEHISRPPMMLSSEAGAYVTDQSDQTKGKNQGGDFSEKLPTAILMDFQR
jgi:hypothetical protein